MENKLDIRKESSGNNQRIFLEGRLDANWSGHLDDYLNGQVREGSYRIILNMAGVQYLSSAGIRILVSQYKKITKIGGMLVLEELSGAVSDVLSMVGMIGMLTEVTKESPPVDKEKSKFLEFKKYQFDNEVLTTGKMALRMTGNPELTRNSGYTSMDNRRIRFGSDQYALGIGAIGEGYDDCKSRYGEFLALGDALVYKPSYGSNIPDYTIKSGKLEPEINALNALQAEGNFSNRISFEPSSAGQGITLADLADGFSKVTGYAQFAFLMIAESAGMVGVSLSAPPVDGIPLFDFPEIRENINFTTEPAYPRMLTVSLGFFSQDPGADLKNFLRPSGAEHSGFIHTHTAVFPFQALPKKEKSAATLVLQLFETTIVQDVLHLINDSREINGLGDSTFKQGIAWIGELS